MVAIHVEVAYSKYGVASAQLALRDMIQAGLMIQLLHA
jgi:hypothetical protein